MAQNREQRRHPTHPGLPLRQPCKETVPVQTSSPKDLRNKQTKYQNKKKTR